MCAFISCESAADHSKVDRLMWTDMIAYILLTDFVFIVVVVVGGGERIEQEMMMMHPTQTLAARSSYTTRGIALLPLPVALAFRWIVRSTVFPLSSNSRSLEMGSATTAWA